MKVSFFYLSAFDRTGGIQKFNRNFLKVLNEMALTNSILLNAVSTEDKTADTQYVHSNFFKGCARSRLKLLYFFFTVLLPSNTIIVGHINLSPVVYLLKKIRPSIRVILIAHGIEVWNKQQGFKKKLLQISNEIWAVSNYTKQVILQNNPLLNSQTIKIFPNTIDYYFTLPQKFDKPSYLLNRYGFCADTKVILMVTRLASTEKFKGYDNLIKVLQTVQANTASSIHFLLCGKYDALEKQRIDELIEQYQVQKLVSLTGYVKDEELTDHYLLADIFVMPSKKEGFGIVFIEAMACGLRVIAGNKDGSVDALDNGNLGTLINPDDEVEIATQLIDHLNNTSSQPQVLQQKVVEKFGFHVYANRLKNYLLN